MLFGGGQLPTSIKPLFVPTKTQAVWVSALERFLTTAERVVHQHLGDDRFYRYLGLSPAARHLVEIDPGYERLAVVCRPDAVYNGTRIAILEVNAGHALVKRLESDEAHFDDLAHLLFDQAWLAEGGQLEDPAAHVQRVTRLLTAA